jgi:hypothetical protein
MAILLEGVSLVFENEVLEEKYPGGVRGLRKDWDNGSFCTDGTISRIADFESDDACCAFIAMPDYGLMVAFSHAADVAMFVHGGAAWAPCLWLETETTPANFQICWHSAAEQGDVAVPRYSRHGATLARYRGLSEESLKIRVSRAGQENGVSLFHDHQSDRLIFGPSPLARH